MTFTKAPPTTPGFYACRINEYDEDYFAVTLVKDKDGFLVSEETGHTPLEMLVEWCRLVPAEEVENAFVEGVEKGWGCSEHTSVGELFNRSRAKQVAEGKL